MVFTMTAVYEICAFIITTSKALVLQARVTTPEKANAIL